MHVDVQGATGQIIRKIWHGRLLFNTIPRPFSVTKHPTGGYNKSLSQQDAFGSHLLWPTSAHRDVNTKVRLERVVAIASMGSPRKRVVSRPLHPSQCSF
eukprot:57465-Heterocapsa_arctica.AAC.1